MILVTTDTVPGREVTRALGVVRGSAVRARHIGRDIVAVCKNIVGGELEEYTKLLAESREQALDRMTAQAAALGADAVTAIRFTSSEIAVGAAEVLVYGTAVKFGATPESPSS